jgi:hypothetical protein
VISGFNHTINDIVRVSNYQSCLQHCWNDVRVRFDHKDFLGCPRHKETPRRFECSGLTSGCACACRRQKMRTTS